MHNTLVCLPFGTVLAGVSRVGSSSSSAPSRSAACRVLHVVLRLPVSPPGPSSAAVVADVCLALQLLVFSVLYQLLFFFAVGAYLLLPVPYAESGSCRADVSVRVVGLLPCLGPCGLCLLRSLVECGNRFQLSTLQLCCLTP